MVNSPKITLINEEVEFKFDQLFFSITDKKGHIKLSNDVFSLVCGYTKEELKGKPHNIIRHPDMPKYLFKILWENIQAGRAVGCYVKNLASNGKYYWVYALVLPVGDQYLSIRLKASKLQVDKVEILYRQIIEAESISDSVVKSLLNQWLWRQQVPSYNTWMSQALHTEIKNRPPSTWQYHFFGQEKPIWKIKESAESNEILKIFDLVWTNVQVLNKTFGEFYAKNDLVTKHFKSFEKLLSDYYDIIAKTFNEKASSDIKNDHAQLSNQLIEGAFYTDLRNYISAVNHVGHTYQFHIDSFYLHTKMLDLFIKNFFSTVGEQKIDYDLFMETIDSILVLAKSVQNFVGHFTKEQKILDEEVKKIITFSGYLNKKVDSAHDKYRPYHAHINVNSEMISRTMSNLTSEITHSVENFINSISHASDVVLDLKNKNKSA